MNPRAGRATQCHRTWSSGNIRLQQLGYKRCHSRMQSVTQALYSTIYGLLYRRRRGRQANCRCLLKHKAYCMSVICCCARADVNLCIVISTWLSKRKKGKASPRYLPRAERHQVYHWHTTSSETPRASSQNPNRQPFVFSSISHTCLAGLPREGTPLAGLSCGCQFPQRGMSGTGILN